MDDEKIISEMQNPHDKLFQETWSNLEKAGSFLEHCMPGQVLRLMDLSGLEIVKDSLIEKDLSDYYSDMLYKVMLKGGARIRVCAV
jgi:predicted transposase YdaD